MWLPSSLGSCWQTKDNKRAIGNAPCPLQPSVHHRKKILISGIAVVVVKLNKQVVKFVAIFCQTWKEKTMSLLPGTLSLLSFLVPAILVKLV